MIIDVHCSACNQTAYLALITAQRQARDYGNRQYHLTCEPTKEAP